MGHPAGAPSLVETSVFQQLSGTVPLRPFGLLAVQVKSSWPPWEIFRVMLVNVSCGFTPVQFEFGQPAAEPDTVDGADSTAGWVVNVRFPFFTSLPGIVVGVVLGPTRTLFWPGAVLPPPFWHW
jgi:hypothetical protein